MAFVYNIFSSTVTQRAYDVIFNHRKLLDCSSSHIVYLITCRKCQLQHVGKTLTALRSRMNGHRNNIRNNKQDCILANHFNGPFSLTDLILQPIETIGDGRDEKVSSFWIKELRTVYPYVLMTVVTELIGAINQLRMSPA